MVRLLAYARHELIAHRPLTVPTGGVSPATDAPPDMLLLLEGSWPSGAPGGTGGLSASVALAGLPPLPAGSLDEAIDGRFDWIDQQAAEFAEQLGGADQVSGGIGRPCERISAAYLNVLALRYYLVKLVRPLAYVSEVQPLSAGDHLELVGAAGRDEDYAEVLSQYCGAAGAHCRVQWVEGRAGPAGRFPANGRWRRWIARLSGCFRPRLGSRGPGRRVVLCGNPRLLDPVCRELLGHGCNLWWLNDRFAVRAWLRWRSAGVGHLACNSSLGRDNRLAVDVPDRLECRGVNLAGPVRRWLTERAALHGPRQTRLVEQIDAHFREVRPEALVLDEDATPLARAALAVGRRYAADSLVVQHGVPYCRFGFTPPAADCILVWGRSSRQRLIDWGVPARQIRLTGSPACDRLWGKLRVERQHQFRRRRGTGRPRILLLATVPPRDERPDAVALHLTSRTYAQMLRTAFAAVAGTDGAELVVKLHPRSGDDPVVRAVRAEFPSVDSRLVCGGRLEKWLAGVNCVLSCGSSAGVEATLAGAPVIQLAPPGGSGFLPHDQWGLAGTARSQPELRELLARVAGDGWRAPPGRDPGVFAGCDRPAAARVADEVLAPKVPAEGAVADGRTAAAAGPVRRALPAGPCHPVNAMVTR